MGNVIGINALTVTNWELNATTPIAAYLPTVIEFLGYDP